MRIKQYPEAMTLADTDDFLVETEGGTKRIAKSTLDEVLNPKIEPEEEEIYDVLALHRNTYRGKNLGSTFTDEQKKVIKDGSFEDLYIGDYWIINSVTWRIMDFDYWLGTGEATEVTDHHLVVMPDNTLYTTLWNSSATVSNGYTGSSLYKTGLNTAKETIKTAFGEENLLPICAVYPSAANNNAITTVVNQENETVMVPNQNMIIGSLSGPISNLPNSGTTNCVGFDKTQLAAFNLNPYKIIPTNGIGYWLRDWQGFGIPCFINFKGKFTGTAANNSSVNIGVRPVFGLKG